MVFSGNRNRKVLGFEPIRPYDERQVVIMDRVDIAAGKCVSN